MDINKNISNNIIEKVVEELYNNNEILHQYKLNELQVKAIERFAKSNLTIEEIEIKLNGVLQSMLEEHSRRFEQGAIIENHKVIYSKLKELVKRLNKDRVDYQLAGALCSYIKYGEESKRTHDDIDICLNEKDMEKFSQVCQELGLNFSDQRNNPPRVLQNGIPCGEHEVIAEENNSDFHIGAFCFERKENGEVVVKGYYKDKDKNTCSRNEILLPKLAKEIYGGETVIQEGIPLKITPPEYIYMLKSYTMQPKDRIDLEFMEDKIDKEKLAMIHEMEKEEFYVEHVVVSKKEKSFRELLVDKCYSSDDIKMNNSEIIKTKTKTQDEIKIGHKEKNLE